MPNQMKRGNSDGTPRAGKPGTKVTKFAMPQDRLFRPRSGDGIAAHGQPKRLESRGEGKDRRVG